MANKALLPLLLIGGAVAAVAMTAQASDELEPEPDNGGGAKPGPGRPILEGGKVVLRGFKTNAGGVKVTFQVEHIAGGGNPKGDYYGVVFRPWENNEPALVGQAETRNAARDQTITFIDTDEHGLP